MVGTSESEGGMNIAQQVLAVREGGQTKRCHTFPHSGSYDVATHSFNALSLLLLLYPGTPSVALITAVLWHDVPERWTGDVPAPAKWASPVLKAELDKLETLIFQRLQIHECFEELGEEELDWLTAVDLLELFIWSAEQKVNGNHAADGMIDRIVELFDDRAEKIPKEVRNFLMEFKWSRAPELGELLEHRG